ncbi:chemotaxis protein CheW [Halorhabdus salina]|uniref:chemotaxis protein CheW n=1 Tax=Halorhabdus salina TaxID=2750670 RepID=UPI0015EF1AAF|nr:chemotaxis protein CheW [Halorhabdus salina]
MAVEGSETQTETGEEIQVLEFDLDDQRYCVEIEYIAEIVDEKTLTPVPDSKRHVRGVMNLREQTTTIIDPKVIFGMDDHEGGHRIIVFESDGDEQSGWLVDEVEQVSTFERTAVKPQEDVESIRGVVSREDGFLLWVDPTVINDR